MSLLLHKIFCFHIRIYFRSRLFLLLLNLLMCLGYLQRAVMTILMINNASVYLFKRRKIGQPYVRHRIALPIVSFPITLFLRRWWRIGGYLHYRNPIQSSFSTEARGIKVNHRQGCSGMSDQRADDSDPEGCGERSNSLAFGRRSAFNFN